MTDQNTELASLREQIETKLARHYNKMYSGERADLDFETDFHGDPVHIVLVKGTRLDEVVQLRGTFRQTEAGRYDGFNVRRDLNWTVDAILTELGL